MRTSRIKAKLARDEPVLVTTLHFADASVFELTSLLGFDGIWLDLEHHGTSVETAAHLMRAARVGSSDMIARPAKGEMMRMGRLLEMGAQGIMYPRCDDADEAAEVVRWAKFAPQGTRGVDGANADGCYLIPPLTDYLQHANANTLIIIQIEDPAALENAEAMAAVDGVDALMLGPGDFSILAGVPGQFDHPLVQQASQRVAAAARAAGKHWGRPVFSVEDARRCMEMGARLLFYGSDIGIVKQGLEKIKEEFAPLGVSFADLPDE